MEKPSRHGSRIRGFRAVQPPGTAPPNITHYHVLVCLFSLNQRMLFTILVLLYDIKASLVLILCVLEVDVQDLLVVKSLERALHLLQI